MSIFEALPAPGASGEIPRGMHIAIAAAHAGYRVFPVTEGNTPFPNSEIAADLGIDPASKGGVHHATADPAAIVKLWSGNRGNARIGLAMGGGLVALDCDEKNGKSGKASLESAGRIPPDTASQFTPSGGAHFIYRLPQGVCAPTDADVLGSGVDRRGEGGFITLYDVAILSAPAAAAPEWLKLGAEGCESSRIAPGQGERAQTYEIARDALLSRDPDMDRNEWLIFSGAFFAATYRIQGGEAAYRDWQAWNVGYGARNDPAGNHRTWADFERNGTAGDFRTLAAIGAEVNAKGWAYLRGIKVQAPPPPFPGPSGSNFFQKAGDMVARDPEYLIAGLIETEALGVIFGDPGSGKSFVAIDIACCLATGKSFHGFSAAKGPTFFIVGEGLNGFRRRLTAWEVHHGVSLNDASLFVSRGPAQFLSPDSARMIIEAASSLATAHGLPRLIVIDTLARNFGIGDENSQKDMTAFVSALDLVRSHFPGCAIIIVHHSGHGDKDRARGSSVLKGAVDFEYRVVRDGDAINFENFKMKDGPQPRPMRLRLIDVPPSAALTHEGEPPIAPPKLNEFAQLALDLLGNEAPEGLPKTVWYERFVVARPGIKPDTVRKSFHRAHGDLVRFGKVTSIDGGITFRIAT